MLALLLTFVPCLPLAACGVKEAEPTALAATEAVAVTEAPTIEPVTGDWVTMRTSSGWSVLRKLSPATSARDPGDGFHMFSGAVNVLDYVMEDCMVLANYGQAFGNSVVDAKNSRYPSILLGYSVLNGSQRIVIA